MKNLTNDLRVIRTRKSIRQAIEEMIIEKDYHELTIKELTKRAGINRRTFYLHYYSLEDLITEIQEEIFQDISFNIINSFEGDRLNVEISTRNFFLYLEKQTTLHQKLMFNSSYQFLFKNVNNQFIKNLINNCYFPSIPAAPEYQSLASVFFSEAGIAIYQQWIKDGKKIPIEELADFASKLLRSGLGSEIRVKDTVK